MPNLTPFASSTPSRRQFAPPPANYVDSRVLAAAGTAETHIIPAGARFVVFACTGDFYAKFGASGVTAAVPATDVTDGTGSELNPEARQILDGVTHISLVSAAAGAIVTMSFYAE